MHVLVAPTGTQCETSLELSVHVAILSAHLISALVQSRIPLLVCFSAIGDCVSWEQLAQMAKSMLPLPDCRH